jgi:hypothetical protein
MGNNKPTNHEIHSEGFLLEEYRHLSESFWRNEEVGEKRVNFFITLVTAVIAALVTLATKGKTDVYPIAVFALFALLVVGIVTLNRMIRRNRVTDEYKLAMDMIRSRFRDWDNRLQNYQPFGKGFLRNLDLEPREVSGDKESFSEKLKNELINKGISDFQNTIIETRGGRHVIIDRHKKRKYIIFEEDGRLKIYDGGKTRHPETGGLVTMTVIMNCLIVAALVGIVTIWLFHLVYPIIPWAVGSGIHLVFGMILGLLGFFLAKWTQTRYVETGYDE